MFTDMLKKRDSFHHNILCESSNAYWHKFSLVLGTVKTFTIHKCIDYCSKNHINFCIGMPTGSIPCVYRERFDDTVVCHTLHSLFRIAKIGARKHIHLHAPFNLYNLHRWSAANQHGHIPRTYSVLWFYFQETLNSSNQLYSKGLYRP